MGDADTPAPSQVPLSGNTQVAAGVPRTPSARLGRALVPDGARAQLVDDLATGIDTPGELAQRYGVTRSAIYAFRDRHRDDIAGRRDELGDAFASVTGLWIASKEARIAELQDGYERIVAMLQADDTDPDMVPELQRTLVTILHEAAEQLGQLPSRVQVQTATVIQYEIPGVDLSQL